MADLILSASVLEEVRRQIEKNLITAGVHTALLVDEAGNIVANCGNENTRLDTTSLAALAAANFSATTQIAKIIGEADFSLLFHKGKKDSIHFARLGDDFILVSIFGDDASLGVVRLRVAQLVKTLKTIFDIHLKY